MEPTLFFLSLPLLCLAFNSLQLCASFLGLISKDIQGLLFLVSCTGVSFNKVSCVHDIKMIIFDNFPLAIKHGAMHYSTCELMCMMPKVAKFVVLLCAQKLMPVSVLMGDLLNHGDYKCQLC